MKSYNLRKTVIAILIVAILGLLLSSCGRFAEAQTGIEADEEANETTEREHDKPAASSPEPDEEDSDTDEDSETEAEADTDTDKVIDIDSNADNNTETNTDTVTDSEIIKGDYILPESNLRRYDYMELYEYFNDQAEAAYARNEIFARHGHTFDKGVYITYFSEKPWYKPTGKVALESLNEFEQYNAKLLLFFEKGYQGSYPPGTEVYEIPQNPKWLVKLLKPGVEFMTDLDDDGTKEKISWIKNLDSEATIRINKLSISVPADNSGNWADHIAIVDLDSNDPYKEIIICDQGPSSDEWSYYYEYRSNKINMIGETSGILEYGSLRPDGKGNVIAATRSSLLQTWFYNKTFKLDKNHRLAAISQDYYNTTSEVFLKSPIKLSKKRDNSNLFTAGDGQAALISATDDKSWCRLTLEDGTEGWFAVEDYSTIVRENVTADVIFDNLCYAD